MPTNGEPDNRKVYIFWMLCEIAVF